jgi:hypothetical protein
VTADHHEILFLALFGTLSPAPRAQLMILHLVPGLTPRALRYRALRALFRDAK